MNLTRFLAALIIISTLGLTTIWSTRPDLFLNQLIFFLAAATLTVVISRLSPGTLNALAYPSYLLCLLLLVFTFILGQATRGSIRWISLGSFNLQTSEIAKPLLIVTMSYFFSQPITDPRKFLLQRIALVAPILFLVFAQPDLGSTIIIASIWFGMLAVSSLPKKYVFGLLAIALLIIPIGTRFLEPYQVERLTSFTNPYADPAESGYNAIQSMIAVGSGQILGKGVRQGTQSHLKFLPERHTDFAFASFAEEFGFIGTVLLLTSLSFILYWLVKSSEALDPQRKLILIGTFWLIFIQAFVNIGMNMGMLPVTGITLPFFSYGGSSLLSLGISLGLVFSAVKTNI